MILPGLIVCALLSANLADEDTGRPLVQISSPAETPADHSLSTIDLKWVALQLLPSPGMAFGKAGPEFALRWQLTPILFSFAHDSKNPRWHTLIVEPRARYGGSVEAFISPEFFAGEHPIYWSGRTGLRVYAPLLGHGEKLSGSLAASYFAGSNHEQGPSFEAGLYTLGGLLGAQVTYSPWQPNQTLIATLSIRYF